MSDPIVIIDHLRKVYEPYSRGMRLLLRTSVKDPVVAIDDISLEVNSGDLLAVLGPNGAGKSTLFRVLTGLTTPSGGRASILGHDTTKDSLAVRRLVGFMPAENRTLMLRHTCRENLAFHGRLQGMSKHHLADRIDETLDKVGLFHARDRVGFALSSGMLARLMLARAILHEPAVLILDEPTGAVDPIGSFELLGLVQEIAKSQEIAVLISSHRLDEVELLNDKVVLLDKGHVVYSGALDAMLAQSRKPVIEIQFDGEESAATGILTLEDVEGIEGFELDESLLVLTTDLPMIRIIEELSGQMDRITSIGQIQPRLRDVLRHMLRVVPGEGEP
ncbi:MAG: ABC transporter ATP-binding protein [Acidimicrobiia bacterium]